MGLLVLLSPGDVALHAAASTCAAASGATAIASFAAAKARSGT